MKRFFDRVVLINLPRHPDRLAQVSEALGKCDWPFRQPLLFPAVDGYAIPPPKGWAQGPGTWGCLCSHRLVLKQAINDGVDRLLILEDDVCFDQHFRISVEEFLREVPSDWDGLMFGGQHARKMSGKPILVKPGIYRCMDCERMHCYAIRGKYLRKLYQGLCGGGKFKGLTHCDHIMCRDPTLQRAHKVYAPEYFLAGQERNQSDIAAGTVFPRKFWNPPGPELSVINLHGPQPLVAALRDHGWYTGSTRDSKTDIDKYLLKVFKHTKTTENNRVKKLREWIKAAQWEVADDRDFICTVWHPEATPGLVNEASLWRVYEVTAQTVGEAMQQIPRKLQKPCLTIFS